MASLGALSLPYLPIIVSPNIVWVLNKHAIPYPSHILQRPSRHAGMVAILLKDSFKKLII